MRFFTSTCSNTVKSSVRWITVVFIFLFGASTLDFHHPSWAILSLGLFSIPILSQFLRYSLFRYGSIWFGIFLVIQALVSPSVLNNDYKTLIPNDHFIMTVKEGLPGIQGPQETTTDQMGFKTTKPINYRDNSTFRVFAIGGSTTQQPNVGNKKTWPHWLQELLQSQQNPNIEVINTGVSGLRARHHLATLRKIIKYHPDMAIFLVGLNDWNWHIKEHFTPEEERISEWTQNFQLRSTMLGELIRSLKNPKRRNPPVGRTLENHGEYYSMQRGSLSKVKQFQFRPETVHFQYREFLEEIHMTCRNTHLDCVFVTQPTGYQKEASKEFQAGFWMTPPNKDYTLDFQSMIHIASLYNRYLIEFSKRNKYRYCDIASQLEPSYDYFIDDCHFNEKGSLRVAELLFTCLNANPQR